MVQEAQEDLADPEGHEVKVPEDDAEVIETTVASKTYWGVVSKTTSWFSTLPFDPVQTRPTLETLIDTTKSCDSKEG